MIVCLALLILLGAVALCRAQHRRAVEWRAGLLADCAPLIEASCFGRDRAGFATLRGSVDGIAVRMQLLPDTLVHRRLPQLWLRVSLRTPLATEGTLAILRRPVGAEFYTPDDFPIRFPVPATWPPDTLVRGTSQAHPLLARAAPDLDLILTDPRVKEILFTPAGLRLTVQVGEGARGSYLLMRGIRFPAGCVSRERASHTMCAALQLTRGLSSTPDEVPHARVA